MSTRCNVKITDERDTLWFYRHSDGYPDGAGENLKHFLRWLLAGQIRDNVGQASGWLILLGAIDYQTLPPALFGHLDGQPPSQWPNYAAVADQLAAFTPRGGFDGWKCGAYEPTTGIHGDIEYLYTIDLDKRELVCAYPDGTVFHTVTAANLDVPIEESAVEMDQC